MAFNLVVWAWSAGYETAAERRKHGVNYRNMMRDFSAHGDHPAMRPVDFGAFEAAVETELGPETTDGPYLVERYPSARVYVIGERHVAELVPRIGTLARAFGLTSAEC